MQIPIDRIEVEEGFNCRQGITVLSVRDLARSIDTNGLITPITITPLPNGNYKVVAGHRRLFACSKILGWASIEAHVMDATPIEAKRRNLAENIERENLNPLEEAIAIEAIYPADQFSCTEVARALGKHDSWVLARRYILRLPPEIQKMFAAGTLKPSRAKAVLDAPDREDVIKALTKGRRPRQACHGLRKRNKAEIGRMMDRLAEMGLDPMGPTITALSWVKGTSTTERLERIVAEKTE
jgi:ParB family transcriptional regulator, chromosome partitioning protein